MLPQSAAEHYKSQQRLVVATLGLTRREWAKMGPEFDASWARVGPRIALLTASAQLGAARAGAAYVPATLAELGQSVDPFAEVDPRAFAGIASDGRPLDSLLYSGVTTAKTAAHTMPPTEALAAGGRTLDMLVHTMVADAGRGAAGVAITARPGIGFVRMLNTPSCSRCAALAGKWFKWNQGFKRHPRCDCTHIASGEQGWGNLTADPSPDQITGLNKGDRAALDNGADLSQVINAKRSVYDKATGKWRSSVDGMTTTEGTTRRATFGGYKINPDGSLTKRPKGEKVPQRLTPAGINRLASDRAEALKLLRQHGYLL